MVARIYNPPVEKPNLDTKRNAFQKKVRAWADLLPKLNVNLRIRQLAFPKQLKAASDNDYTVPF